MERLPKGEGGSNIPLSSENAPGGIIVYYADGDEEIIHANQYVIDLLECESFDDFMEHTQGTFRGFVYADDLSTCEDSIWGQVEKQANQRNLDHIYYRVKTKSGRLVDVEDFGHLVQDAEGRPVFHVFLVELKERGSIDWLTKLPSMARFHHLAEMGAKAIRGRGSRPAAIALDLMGLKAFNAEYGRDEGDRLLRAFADVLRNHFGSEACSRFAEDHFYAFAPERGVQGRIDQLFSDFKQANDGRVVPVRAGAYTCEEGDDIVAVGFDRAKIACDLDKHTWESHLLWFDERLRTELRVRMHVLDHVEDALVEGWIRPFYQPVVRASTGYVCGEEALARWVDPHYGMISPNLFVPILEEAGVLHKLDMHIVDCAIADMETKRLKGVPVVPVSINISLRDLGSIDIASEVLKRVDEAKLPHELIRVEFTESAATHDPDQFNAQVKVLRDNGIDVWMDDFGSGNSSLNMLQQFDFDLIKLDINFARDLGSEKCRKIVAGVVNLTTKLGLRTLAEGVETKEQAVFLESIGCNMLQGYYYTEPQPLEIVMGRFLRGVGMKRECMDEFEYWNVIGAVDLVDPTSNVDGRAVDGTPLAEFPAGIMERRGDVWRILRANTAYREFLDRGGAIPLSAPTLEAVEFEHGVDIEYSDAAKRSISTGMWERVAGRMEFGTGLQFYTRPIALIPNAEAFVLAAVPTMLGTALGTYGDVPVAYAVLRAILDREGTHVVDAEYVFANTTYCQWCNYPMHDLAGRSFLSLTGDESWIWFPYCYQAAVLGENTRGVLYSDEVGHWLSFTMAPAAVEGCFIYAFTIADDEHRERQEIIMGRDTSDLIIGIADVFNGEKSYDVAMNGVLEMVSRSIHPERLSIFVRGKTTASAAFEWCAEGVDSNLETLQGLRNEDFLAWERFLGGDEAVLVPDIEKLQDVDVNLWRIFKSQGVERVLAVPLRNGEELLGYLVADNYSIDESLDTKRLLETVASFISSRMANQRLVEELESAGLHDYLTGILNRRGADAAIAARLAAAPDEPFALALIDVDDFKTLNDMYGHDLGDEVLQSLARLITSTLTDSAIVSRNGGDEFLAMLFGDEARRADELFASLSGGLVCFKHEGAYHEVSISIGYVEYPEHAKDLMDAYTKADTALYAVKLAGKSGYRRYVPGIESDYRSLLGFSSRDVAENIPGGIMVHKADGTREILFVNDELREMMECESLAELVEFSGGVSENLIHPDDRARVYEGLARQAQSAKTEEKGFSNYRLVTKNGHIKHVAANSRLVETESDGKVFYVILVDLGERDDA